MRALATIFLVLGLADLAVVDFVLAPAAMSGGVGGRGSGVGDGTERVSIPPGAIASVAPEPPAPVMMIDRDPDPGAVAVPHPPTPTPQLPPPEDHPDALPAPVLLHYDLDSDALGHSSRARLDRVADLLDERPELRVHIEGHADESGSEEHNQSLSERRAQAVADYLEERGVPAPRLSVSAFGELQPVEAGDERDRKNRRVEIRFASSAIKGDPE